MTGENNTMSLWFTGIVLFLVFLATFIFFVIRQDANLPRMNGEVIRSYCSIPNSEDES